MAMDFLRTDCATLTSKSATGNLFIKPKNNSLKIRAIFNGQFANSEFPFHPTHFTLPNFKNLKVTLRNRTLIFFHRTDVSNFYWSFTLPPSHTDAFIFTLLSPGNTPFNFSLTRPPFG
jgi:hypothetical protein